LIYLKRFVNKIMIDYKNILRKVRVLRYIVSTIRYLTAEFFFFFSNPRITHPSRQKKLSVTDYRVLSIDRPILTPEFHYENAYYGIGCALKQYAGLGTMYRIKASIEHGLLLNNYYWEKNLHAPLPGIMCISSAHRTPFLRTMTNKKIFAVGPYIHYAPLLYDEEKMDLMRREMAPTLLVFPSHSCHNVDADCSEPDEFLNEIKKIRCDYKTCLICLFWKDVNRGMAEIFKEIDCKFVTAGHMYDPAFLSRLRTIIELSDYTMSNEVGTHFGYCVHLRRPHYFVRSTIRYSGKKDEEKAVTDIGNSAEAIRLSAPFTQPGTTVTPQQQEVIDYFFGTSDVRTPEELRGVFSELDSEFRAATF